MKIAVMSDSHDNIENIKKVLDKAKDLSAQIVLHCGDIVAPFVYFDAIEKYSKDFKFYFVFGNNDGEKFMWLDVARENENIDFATEDFRELEVDSRKIFMTHYPDIAKLAFLSGKYDAVFYGHTHKILKEQNEKGQILLNPGEVVAIRTKRLSFALYDTESNDAELITLA